MTLVLQGRTSKEIAREFGISSLTVRKHRENLLRKLGLRSTAQLMALAPAGHEGSGGAEG
jgi:DNA-binding CsgD family transcriptional regulator